VAHSNPFSALLFRLHIYRYTLAVMGSRIVNFLEKVSFPRAWDLLTAGRFLQPIFIIYIIFIKLFIFATFNLAFSWNFDRVSGLQKKDSEYVKNTKSASCSYVLILNVLSCNLQVYKKVYKVALLKLICGVRGTFSGSVSLISLPEVQL